MSCELEIFLSFLAAILPSSLRIVCQYVLELHRNKDKLLSQQKKQKKEKKLWAFRASQMVLEMFEEDK